MPELSLSALWTWLGILLPQTLAQRKCWVGCRPPTSYWPLGFLLFMDPGFLFCKLTSQLLGFWDWSYLSGDCWPQPSRSDAFGPVSKELSGDATIAAVDLKMTLEPCCFSRCQGPCLPQGCRLAWGPHWPALCEIVLSSLHASPIVHSCPFTFLMGTQDTKGDDRWEFAFEALASQKFILPILTKEDCV